MTIHQYLLKASQDDAKRAASGTACSLRCGGPG